MLAPSLQPALADSLFLHCFEHGIQNSDKEAAERTARDVLCRDGGARLLREDINNQGVGDLVHEGTLEPEETLKQKRHRWAQPLVDGPAVTGNRPGGGNHDGDRAPGACPLDGEVVHIIAAHAVDWKAGLVCHMAIVVVHESAGHETGEENLACGGEGV
ncbi:hypothetical protein MCOR25_007229 [Pyricularia grisea]|nr:hypothetical protein MCOR25_007229 [Pyricularia grisea]